MDKASDNKREVAEEKEIPVTTPKIPLPPQYSVELRDKKRLREAVVLSEILSPCRGKRRLRRP